MLITREVPWQDPLRAFAAFANDPVAALLHGDDEGEGETTERGRWSYIAASPFCKVNVDQSFCITVDGEPQQGDPFHVLNTLMSRYRGITESGPAPFVGGAVGFFAYELGGVVEDLPTPKTDACGPLMSVALYDVIAAFDRRDQKAWVIASGFPEQDQDSRQERASARSNWMTESMACATDRTVSNERATWAHEQPRQSAEESIRQAISYIRAGDIFQANITQRFTTLKPKATSSWDLFRRLRNVLPSPFGAYLSAGPNFQLLSASPERFLSMDADGCVETRPIKGTRPRGQTPEQDKAFIDALASSAKDRAENLMIVDLMRNDLARVCETGSIRVPQCNAVETFWRVHHLVSVVTGQLRADQTAVDLLRACFPGGSVTGAPKVRAMEVIHELEPTARGPYCGTVAWLGFDGAMDSSIVIRSLIVDGETVMAHAGGGIVADSEPALEYEEAMVKIRPLLSVLSPSDDPINVS